MTQHRRSDSVYTQLFADIFSLRVAPGTVLREMDLSKRYAASRTPVREALFRLHQDGFIEKFGRNLRVRIFTHNSVRELYEVREGLEKMAVRLCITEVDNNELYKLAKHLDHYETLIKNPNYDQVMKQLNRFHRIIAQLSANRLLAQRLTKIYDKTLLINLQWLQHENPIETAFTEHKRILSAIDNRDVTVAEACVREHIQGVIELYKGEGISCSNSSPTNPDLVGTVQHG